MFSVPVDENAVYTTVLSTDDEKYGGFGRIAPAVYVPKKEDGKNCIEIAIPTQTAIVFKMEKKKK